MAYSYEDAIAALRAADAAGNVEDATRLAQIAASLRDSGVQEEPVVPTQAGSSSDLVRGFKSYLPQTQETFGGFKTLLGKTIGSEGLVKSGLESIQEAQQKQAYTSKESDSLANAWEKGVGTVLTDWLPYQVGIGGANILEALAASGAGAFAGSVAGPGGTVAGGLSGFVGKQLVKKGIKAEVEKIAAEKGLEEAEKYTAKKTAEYLASKDARKEINKYMGSMAGIAADAQFHGMGEVTSRAVQEAIGNVQDPDEQLKLIDNLDTGSLLGYSTAHGLADYFATKFGLDALDKLANPTKSFIKDAIKNISITGAKESVPETLQTMLERSAANLPLDDQQAIQEYIDTIGASFGMSVIPGAVGAARGRTAPTRQEIKKEDLKELDKTKEEKTEVIENIINNMPAGDQKKAMEDMLGLTKVKKTKKEKEAEKAQQKEQEQSDVDINKSTGKGAGIFGGQQNAAAAGVRGTLGNGLVNNRGNAPTDQTGETGSNDTLAKFTTTRGSTYEMFGDNTTIRNRSGKNHVDTTTGKQPRTNKTVFMTEQDAMNVLGGFQNPDIPTQLVPNGDEAVLIVSEDYAGYKKGQILARAPYTLQPQVGLNPVEIYDSRSPLGDAGKGVHVGTKITKVEPLANLQDQASTEGQDVNAAIQQGTFTPEEAALSEERKAIAEGKTPSQIDRERAQQTAKIKEGLPSEESRLAEQERLRKEKQLQDAQVIEWDKQEQEKRKKAVQKLDFLKKTQRDDAFKQAPTYLSMASETWGVPSARDLSLTVPQATQLAKKQAAFEMAMETLGGTDFKKVLSMTTDKNGKSTWTPNANATTAQKIRHEQRSQFIQSLSQEEQNKLANNIKKHIRREERLKESPITKVVDAADRTDQPVSVEGIEEQVNYLLVERIKARDPQAAKLAKERLDKLRNTKEYKKWRAEQKTRYLAQQVTEAELAASLLDRVKGETITTEDGRTIHLGTYGGVQTLETGLDEDIKEVKAKTKRQSKAKKVQEKAAKETKKVIKEVKTEQQIKTSRKNMVNTRVLQALTNPAGTNLNEILDAIAGDSSKQQQFVYQTLARYFKNFISTLPGIGQVNIKVGNIKNGRPGQFNPTTNTITIDPNNIGNGHLGTVVMHETMHYLVDHIIDNPTNLSTSQKNALDKLNQLHKQVEKILGKQFEIYNLKEFIAEAFTNTEFQKALSKVELPTTIKAENPIKTFTNTILRLLGLESFFRKVGDIPVPSAPTLNTILANIEHILLDPEYKSPDIVNVKGKSISYAPKVVPTEEDERLEGIDLINSYSDQEKLQDKSYKDRASELYRQPGKLETLRKLFSNSRQVLKKWQDDLVSADKISYAKKGFTNIYDKITMAFGKAQVLDMQYIAQNRERLHALINTFADAKGIDLNQAQKLLQGYRTAVSEPERRKTLYVLSVLLSDTPIKVGNRMISPANLRQEILDLVTSDKFINMDPETREPLAKALRKELDELVFKKDANGNLTEEPSQYVDPAGSSPDHTKGDRSFKKADGTMAINLKDDAFNVIANHSYDQVKSLQQLLRNEEDKIIVDHIFDTMNKLNEATKELNRQGGYWSKATDTITDFYGWKNYSPYKVKPNQFSNRSVSRLNLGDGGTMLGREGRDYAGTMFEGSTVETENPLIQTLIEATLATIRAGKQDTTQAIKNASKKNKYNPDGQNLLNAEVIANYSFEDRFKGKVDESLLRAKDVIYHYNEDGSMDLIRIKNPEMLEAIRRTYKQDSKFIDILNSATSFLGQTHTRLNIPFAPVNFTRDVLTNMFNMYIDTDLKTAGQFGGAAANMVLRLGFVKTGQVAKAYINKDWARIKQLNASDKTGFVKDLIEYLKAGGNVAVVQSFAVAGQVDQLMGASEKNKILLTKDEVGNFFDSWTQAWEFAARASAYKVMKANFIKDNRDKGYSQKESERRATEQAAAYVKRLANFEEVGTLGKEMGAFFMFFRASAVGASRAIEGLEPAFRSWESVESQLDDVIRNDPVALENSKKEFMRKKQAGRIAMAALMGLGMITYYMSVGFSGDDEEDENKMLGDDLARWTKFARFDIGKSASGEERVIQIPWGFGLGAFAAWGAQLAGAVSSRGNGLADVMGNIITIGMDSFLPLPVSRINPIENPEIAIVDSVLPSVVRPFVEHAMNKNALGQEIYNNRQSKFGDAYTGGDNIPSLYKDAAILLQQNTGVDVSPNSIYFYANNYLDGITRLLHNGYGIYQTSTGQKDFDAKRDLIVFESFMSSKSNYNAREFAKIGAEMEQKSKDFESAKLNPEQYSKYIQNNPTDPMLIQSYNTMVNGNLKTLQTQANVIRRMYDLTPKERNELLQQNKLLQNAVKSGIINSIQPFLD
jgi:hypothetical protein